MGVSWSKELSALMVDDPNVTAEQAALTEAERESKLPHDALCSIFGYFGSMDDLVPIAMVNRWWAALLGEHVVPGMVGRMQLKAWYDETSIRAGRKVALTASATAPSQQKNGTVINAGFGSGATVAACDSWPPNAKGASELLLGAFAFPRTLRARAAAAARAADPNSSAGAAAMEAMGPPGAEWIATPSKAVNAPRVITSKAGRRAVQFINLRGSEPVHLRTAQFTEALPQPITIVCVGIAFEDATYLSGLNNRFELCHAYPHSGMFYPGSQQPSSSERAPVSMTAHPVGDSSDSDDEPNPSFVVSGATQPGQWHVYSAGEL
jgi:hypothetical protein